MRVIRLLAAAPLVALLGAAMVLAAWPDGDVTARERELVARLTRSGVQRLDTDGSHWTADATDLADTIAPTPDPAQPLAAAATVTNAVAPPTHSTLLAPPALRQLAGRPADLPGRGRAPPRR